jgi:hypothetical protein
MTKVELYNLETQDPTAHSAELLLMLHRRDHLVETEGQLSLEERRLLRKADERLLQAAAAFYEALSGIDVAARRTEKAVPPERWWWYLDVLAHLPLPATPDAAPETTRAAAS